MAKPSKSKQKKIATKNKNKVNKSFKTGLIVAIIGFIPLAAVWAYMNRDEPIWNTMATLLVAAIAAACGLWIVYLLNSRR